MWAIAQVAHQKWASVRIPQVAYQKWATMSDLLRLLTKNEQKSKSLVFLSKSLIRLFFRKKWAIR